MLASSLGLRDLAERLARPPVEGEDALDVVREQKRRVAVGLLVPVVAEPQDAARLVELGSPEEAGGSSPERASSCLSWSFWGRKSSRVMSPARGMAGGRSSAPVSAMTIWMESAWSTVPLDRRPPISTCTGVSSASPTGWSSMEA